MRPPGWEGDFLFWGATCGGFLRVGGWGESLPLIGEAMAVRKSKASPFRGGGSAERRDGEVVPSLQQPLSQPAADSISTPFVPSGHFPLTGGIGP